MVKKAKTKRLALKPSVRDKRRYFIADSSNAKIEEAILEYIGVLGMAKAAYMKVKPVNKKLSGQTIGSCLVKSLEEVRAALAFKGIKITKVSGTIKGLGMN